MRNFTRRDLLKISAGSLAAALAPTAGRARAAPRQFRLRPQPARADLLGLGGPPTEVWAYDGVIPGPEIRIRRGERALIEVENRLAEETTVHWHGLRIPNAMDGVPNLTQPPIPPGGRFLYDFEVPDAGTFWYHSHVRSPVQQGRGLYGAFIVEEREPPKVDRDLIWVIDDWRLTKEGAISEPFNNAMDLTHAGRLGNVATLNGRANSAFQVQAGERLRLRLINTANARIFALRFEGHRPVVISLDGQPVEPHALEGRRIVLPPAARADLILDMEGDPGAVFPVVDDYHRFTYTFLDLVYSRDPPIRNAPPEGTIALAPNPLPEPDLAGARRHEVVLAGGAMGGMQSAILDGAELGRRALAARGKMWAINGVASHRVDMPPLFTLERNRTHLLSMRNETAFPHPMHLHGYSFRVLTRNGRPTAFREWLDTVLVDPNETVEVAFVADNPGDWLFHCHILEHMEAGMYATLRVT